MSLYANICVGAIIDRETLGELVARFLDEDAFDEYYGGYYADFLSDLFDGLGISADIPGYSDGTDEIVLVLDETMDNSYYGAEIIDVKVLTTENIDKLKFILDFLDIKYETVGILLYPTYG